MSAQAIYVTVIVIFLLIALIRDRMRPGLVLLSGAILFYVTGILTPKEMLEGFSNKGMITVALLFLVSEGVRRSGLLEKVLIGLLPKKNASIRRVQWRMLPVVSFISAFLNNTPVVVIFAPMVKRWAEKMHQPASKLLIPLSYATILGGVCTLIGTSTNLVIHGMALDEAARHPNGGVRGLSMFELSQIGLIVAVVGLFYIIAIGSKIPPEHRESAEETPVEEDKRIEVVLAPRFPAIGKKVADFDFEQKYGAQLLEIHRGGQIFHVHDMRQQMFHEGDTLVLAADDNFMANWGDSSFFLVVNDMRHLNEPMMGPKMRWFTIILLILMVLGATIGELPPVVKFANDLIPGLKFDMFFFVCVVTLIMAWLGMFPARKYTKFVSWDILIAIASAFAISKAMQNSGMADAIAQWAVSLAEGRRPQFLLGVVFIIGAVFTELMTNNAAAALCFPIAISLAQHMGVSPMPFIVTLCIAASSSFCTPIGYQTNLIVQGIGGYKFSDYFKIGLPLSFIVGTITVLVVPLIWSF